jgi:tetratricopeptide (TPR) repeat protein
VWAQALPDSYLALIVTTRLGGAAFFVGRQNRAREAWEQSLAIAQLQRNKVRESILLNNLGDIYRFFGEYARAQQAQERSLHLARQMGDQIMQINVLEGLTRTYTSLGMYAQGEIAVKNCLSLAHTLHKWATLVFALNAQGHLYRAQKKFIQAEESYRQAIAFVSTKPDLAHVLLETYAGLAEIAMAQGRVGEAFTAVAQFRELEARTPLEHYLDVTWLFAVVADVLQAQGEEAIAEQYRQEVRLYVTRHLQALAMEPERQAAYRARVALYLPK